MLCWNPGPCPPSLGESASPHAPQHPLAAARLGWKERRGEHIWERERPSLLRTTRATGPDWTAHTCPLMEELGHPRTGWHMEATCVLGPLLAPTMTHPSLRGGRVLGA